MKSVVIVYKVDNWHSYSSRDIIGVVDESVPDNIMNIIQAQAKKEGHVITSDEIVKDQTQGYEGDGEFAWEHLELNKLL